MASSAARADRERAKGRSERGALKGPGDPSPIFAEGRAPAVLAIHGFGGTPLEVEVVASVAKDLGRRTLAPLLPGHGTHADDLARTRWADWTSAVETALDELTAEDEPAIVLGLSLGSLLATHLAVTRPRKVRALGLLANAFWLMSPFPAWALAAVDRLKIPDFRLPKVAADIGDPEARRTHLTYGEHPVHAAVEVQRVGAMMREKLAQVNVPTLIVHGERDRVCPASNARRVAALVSAKDVDVVMLPRSRHIITRDLERAKVAEVVRAFVQRHG